MKQAWPYTAGVILWGTGLTVAVQGFGRQSFPVRSRRHDSKNSFQFFASTATDDNELVRISAKSRLMDLLDSTPSNVPTSNDLTAQILNLVRELEASCPTSDNEVLSKLGGNWELLWTAQDPTSEEWGLGPLRTWINPLENQSYSNHPNSKLGRANPVLPRNVQDTLEEMGLIENQSDPLRSSQSVDLRKRQVRNVVSFTLPAFGRPRKATLTVTVDFTPDNTDQRKIKVKFQACRVSISNSPLDFNIPLGVIGPTGWLRTKYIDEQMRITRGHKGSIFILTRPGTELRTLTVANNET